MVKKICDLDEGDRVKGTVQECACGTLFIASRSDARYCSNACRMKQKRGTLRKPIEIAVRRGTLGMVPAQPTEPPVRDPGFDAMVSYRAKLLMKGRN